MDYTELTADQQYRTVQQRLLQLEQQHLMATINQAAAGAAGEAEQAATFATQAVQWEKSAAAVREILDGMSAPVVRTPEPPPLAPPARPEITATPMGQPKS